MTFRISSIENWYQQRVPHFSLWSKIEFKHGSRTDCSDKAHVLEHFFTFWHFKKNSSFVFEVSTSLCCAQREVPWCAIPLDCYLHSLFKISITFLPRDGFQCWTKLFMFTTNLPVLTSSCPATRYSKPGLRIGQVQPLFVHDSGYNVRFPRKIFNLVDFKTFLTFTLTSAWEPLSWADKIFIFST